jgi:hypothetical protein
MDPQTVHHIAPGMVGIDLHIEYRRLLWHRLSLQRPAILTIAASSIYNPENREKPE